MPNLFSKTARWYDAIYRKADQTGMAETIVTIAADRCRSRPLSMLDIACGTGHLLECIANRTDWHLEGLDADPEMLRIARERLPGARFHEGDMAGWHIDRQFDIITCLGSSLAAVGTPDRLTGAFASMERHLASGGIVLFDESFTREQWRPGTLSAIFVDEPDLKIARMSTSKRRDDLAILNMAYLVGTPNGIEYITEQHELGLFDMDDYRNAFTAARMREVTGTATDLKGVFTNRGTHLLERVT
jgi:ubiquinone/menaquinone biosynthesis C-methylase UbiE